MQPYRVKLENLLEDRKQFVVPLFQRPYSWKKKNWNELWRDLLDIYSLDNNKEHFMGAVVTMPIQMQPHGVNKFLLIDGQQRLTTILVVLCCIRDLAGRGVSLHDEIEDIYLTNRHKSGSNRDKLLPTQADRGAYRDVIQGTQKSGANLTVVYDHFMKLLKANEGESESIDLDQLFNAMKSQLLFVSIVLDANDNPYHIFHSLNATGAPLTQADLVRNHIFMHIREDDQEDAYNDKWLPLQDAYEGKELQNYIWRFMTKDGEVIRQNGVYDAVRKRVADLDESGNVNQLLLDLKLVSEYYDRILEPSKESNSRIRFRLQRIRQWDLTTVYPLLLNLYIAERDKGITTQAFCEILDTVESFIVRRHICSIPIRQLTNYFIRIFKDIKEESDLVAATKVYLLKRKFPTDEVFLDNWVRHPLYGGSLDKCRFILESLESFETRNHEPVDVRHSRITIEHVMPQTLTPEWRCELGTGADAVRDQYIHTVGNLTLTGQNESMGNKPFSQKQRYFSESNFALNSYFGNQDTWNAEAIVKRAEVLGKRAMQIWKRPSQ